LRDTINYTEDAPDVLSKALDITSEKQRIALVSSIEIEGGSARKAGSLAVVSEDGGMHGYLSNGCIDRDIQLQALEALTTNEARVVRYGRGSKFLDLQLPCGGALTLLIDPQPDLDALGKAHADLLARRETDLTFTPPEGASIDPVKFRYQPKFRLVLAGRGAVFRAVVRAANAAGFEVFALTPDETDIEEIARDTFAPPRKMTTPDASSDLFQMDEHTAFLTLFHDHEWEAQLIRDALETQVRFIGCLGSKTTHMGRLAQLSSLGVSTPNLERVKGPIGVVPALRDANLIALSALAEIATLRPNDIVRLPT